MRATLAAMDEEVARAKSRRACGKLIDLPEFHDARVVMIYLDIPNEVDAADVARAAWRDGKTVLAPKVTWEQKCMEAMEINSLHDELVHTPQGLREPSKGEPWPIGDIDLIVVPALAYDRKGNRLGRGGGFYDRFLASENLRATTCGLAFAEQALDELPVHANDLPVDILVTDEEVLRFDANTRQGAPSGSTGPGAADEQQEK